MNDYEDSGRINHREIGSGSTLIMAFYNKWGKYNFSIIVNSVISLTVSIISTFAQEHNLHLNAFQNCEADTSVALAKMLSLFEMPPFSSDEDVVVYGSLARREFTSGSDIDWTLLVDGQANASHPKLVNEIRKRFRDNGFRDPGSSGVFGQISFSHELIHHIGGQADTNDNLTKRVLLLLESSKVNFSEGIGEGTAYDRIINGILGQYIEHDSGLNSNREAIPRFLLNDIVRFWRTMCVDFAYKQKEQGGDKWALRNIKLRVSRKMLFVKGLLMCFSHYGKEHDKPALIESLKSMVKQTPIELLINSINKFDIDKSAIIQVINCYEGFLTKLADATLRKDLEKLNMEEIYQSEVFINLRTLSDDLQIALDRIFLHDAKLSKLTLQYGIF